MKMDSPEKLEGYLKSIKLVTGVEWVNPDKYGFSRELRFEVRGNKYTVIWFVNYSSLIIDKELTLLFDELEYNGFYPNRFKNNLVFKYGGCDTLVLPVEEYENLGGNN